MERAISEMEKIRRAEEIYARRKNERVDEKENGPKSIYKFLFQVLLLINITIVVIAVQNKNYIFTPNFLSQVSSYNVNIKEKIEDWFKQKEAESTGSDNTNAKENENNENKESLQNTSSQDSSDSIVVSGESNDVNSGLVENTDVQELSQMEKDALEIKEKYSISLPFEGGVRTSGFGTRQANSIVTAYHTGVDIGATKGTVIKAGNGGTVTLCSSQGDYGQHLRITDGDLTILYAHCSKMYVKEGDVIEKNQPIAEVGSTRE